jgi:sucrose-6-phosphate hydrolase SacC (GH32 family)
MLLPETAHAVTLQIVVEFSLGSATRFGLRLRESGDQGTVVGYDTRSGSLYIDRSASGNGEFHDAFPAIHHGPLVVGEGRVHLRIYVDATSVEVFGGHGECVLTDLIFPDDDSRVCSLFAEGGDVTVTYLDVTPLRPAFAG